MCGKSKFLFAAAAFVSGLIFVSDGFALPWDRDLFEQQSFKPGEMARQPAKGTVPKGFVPFTLTTEEAEATLKNPVEANFDSVWRGKSLWNANCRTCHGAKGDGGPVAQAMGAPNLLTDIYKQRSEGRTYGVLMHGGSNMPRYGYKFSENERWDVINYLKFLQGRDLPEAEKAKLKRPE